jgi:hypothetical protein
MKKVNLPSQQGRVVISQNIQKVSERVDMYGNVIDPRTKQIIKKAEDNKEEK